MLLGISRVQWGIISTRISKQCRPLFPEQLCIRGMISNETLHNNTTTLASLSSLIVLKSMSSRRSGLLLFRNSLNIWELGCREQGGSWDGVSIGEVGEEWGELSPPIDTHILQ
jgi:hypothetical protein